MEEDAAATQGFDLLGLALGRVPGGTDLDEFVDFEIYFDGTQRASLEGEAVPFLRSRLCDFFQVVSADLDAYLWHRDRFVLEVDLGEHPDQQEPRLSGHVRTGDGAEDEWFVVHLLKQYTSMRADAACRVVDSDGELLLIETALAAPRWLDPSNAEHRCWLRGGQMHILPRPRPPEQEKISCRDALARLRAVGQSTVAKEKVQAALASRLAGYPRKAVDLSKHFARAVLPKAAARALIAYPQLVAVAVDHLPPAPSQELARLRRELSGEVARANLDCEGLSEGDVVCVGIRFTRCQYARLVGLRTQLPQRFTLKHWKAPPGSAPNDKAMRLGQMLCAGLETAFLQDPEGATAALQWPSVKVSSSVLPPVSPWWLDDAFKRHVGRWQALEASSVACRRAFVQQAELDSSFQEKLAVILRDATLMEAIDLEAHWRDQDDSEAWLHVSAEEIDAEMMARQAEFDAFDRRRASGSAERAANVASKGDQENLKRELAEMGQQITSLLESSSGAEGVERTTQTTESTQNTQINDSDTDDSEGEEGELDVLGMEDGDDEDEDDDDHGPDEEDGLESAENFRSYMAELDEQLGVSLDTPIAEQADGQATTQGPRKSDGLPLHSHHVKVHDTEPLDLDLHAMEHLLASFCSEHQLEPGPASLLLGELGIAGPGAARRNGAVAPKVSGSCGPQGCELLLDGMD